MDKENQNAPEFSETNEEPNLTSQPAEKTGVDVQFVNNTSEKIITEVNKVIIGNEKILELVLVGMLTGGHVLLEGVPGVAKTLMARLLARSMQLNFQRIQFTPDLMPSDLLGVNVFNQKTSSFSFRKGPLFTNLVLIDEVNRAPAKTQAALFEVMEEKQITVDGQTYPMDLPFFVIATQNPVEHEGTYKLPEAQLDRFMFRLKLPYPSLREEEEILRRFKNDFSSKTIDQVNQLISPKEILQCLELIEQVHIKEELLGYIAAIIHETRNNGNIYLGASPRASLAVMQASKAMAALRGRNYVTPDDIKSVVIAVLNHRILLTPEKEMEGITPETVIEDILQNIEVPR